MRAAPSTPPALHPYLLAMDTISMVETQSNPELPVRIMDHLWLGDLAAAEDVSRLRELGITHVLQCADREAAANYGDMPTLMLGARDEDGYDMRQHLPVAASFIERARASGGRVLVHCMAGINRSGFIVAVELMLNARIEVLEALRRCFRARGLILLNESFRKQLLQTALAHGLLGSPEVWRGSEGS
jgi:protein tyrosine phosphatase